MSIKHIIIVISIISIVLRFNNIKSQCISIEYEKSSTRNFHSLVASLSKDKALKLRRILRETKKVFTLDIVNDKSAYSYLKTIHPVGLEPYHETITFKTIFKNFTKDKIIIQTNQNKGVNESINKLNEWTIMSSDSIIDNYKVISAINQNDGAIAWYAPDIPISNGPMQYGGLPGLIFMLKIGTIKIELVQINFTKDCDEIKFPQFEKLISYKSYAK